MAMIRPRPYWVTLMFGIGLVCLFLGQRVTADSPEIDQPTPNWPFPARLL